MDKGVHKDNRGVHRCTWTTGAYTGTTAAYTGIAVAFRGITVGGPKDNRGVHRSTRTTVALLLDKHAIFNASLMTVVIKVVMKVVINRYIFIIKILLHACHFFKNS